MMRNPFRRRHREADLIPAALHIAIRRGEAGAHAYAKLLVLTTGDTIDLGDFAELPMPARPDSSVGVGFFDFTPDDLLAGTGWQVDIEVDPYPLDSGGLLIALQPRQ